jgi:hypothetical protein
MALQALPLPSCRPESRGTLCRYFQRLFPPSSAGTQVLYSTLVSCIFSCSMSPSVYFLFHDTKPITLKNIQDGVVPFRPRTSVHPSGTPTPWLDLRRRSSHGRQRTHWSPQRECCTHSDPPGHLFAGQPPQARDNSTVFGDARTHMAANAASAHPQRPSNPIA